MTTKIEKGTTTMKEKLELEVKTYPCGDGVLELREPVVCVIARIEKLAKGNLDDSADSAISVAAAVLNAPGETPAYTDAEYEAMRRKIATEMNVQSAVQVMTDFFELTADILKMTVPAAAENTTPNG